MLGRFATLAPLQVREPAWLCGALAAAVAGNRGPTTSSRRDRLDAMRWLFLFALGGCDQVLNLDVPRPAPGLPTCGASMPLLSDPFTETTPCAPWGTLTKSTGTGSASEGDGQLVFAMANMVSMKCATSMDLAIPYGGVVVRIGQLPTGTMSSMSLESPKLGAELYSFAGLLNFAPPGGGPPPVKIPYDGAKMTYWRLMPIAGTTLVAGSYSADGVTWTELPARLDTGVAFPASIDVEIKAHALGAAGTVDAIFSYLLACP
jgi:hypothetical protein